MGKTIRALAKEAEEVASLLTLENIEQSDLDTLQANTTEILDKLDELEKNNNLLKDFINSLDSCKGLDVDRDILEAVHNNSDELY
ncbi:MAG: hypothetical protein ABFD07_10050 [Methanobacterium sp.]